MSFICDTCNKSLRHKRNLTRHTRVHTEEKKLKCDGCDKIFRRQSNLVQHKLTHSKFPCKRCNMFLKRRNKYREHISECEGVDDLEFVDSHPSAVDQPILWRIKDRLPGLSGSMGYIVSKFKPKIAIKIKEYLELYMSAWFYLSVACEFVDPEGVVYKIHLKTNRRPVFKTTFISQIIDAEIERLINACDELTSSGHNYKRIIGIWLVIGQRV